MTVLIEGHDHEQIEQIIKSVDLFITTAKSCLESYYSRSCVVAAHFLSWPCKFLASFCDGLLL
jgi:hypothetical protein